MLFKTKERISNLEKSVKEQAERLSDVIAELGVMRTYLDSSLNNLKKLGVANELNAKRLITLERSLDRLTFAVTKLRTELHLLQKDVEEMKMNTKSSRKKTVSKRRTKKKTK